MLMLVLPMKHPPSPSPMGFQLLKSEFYLPAETRHLPPQLKREVTICNLFVNHRLRAIDIIRVLDETYERIVFSLIKHQIVLDRRQNQSTVETERRRSAFRASS